MPEEDKKNEEEKNEGAIKVQDAVKNLESKIDEKTGATNQRFDGLERTLEGIKTKQDEIASSSKEDNETENDDDEDDPVTKKDIKKIISKNNSEIEKTAEKIAQGIYETNASKRNSDDQAFSDFPMMYSKSPDYDPEFWKDVQDEASLRKKNGEDSQRSSFVSDVASCVYARWSKNGKITSLTDAEREQQRLNNQDSTFSIKGTRDVGPDKPNAKHYEFAGRLGMDKKTLDKNWKPPERK